MFAPLRTPLIAAAALFGALALAGCGGSSHSTEGSQPAPSASLFPAPKGQTLQQILGSTKATQGPVVAPAGAVQNVGKNRYAFGVFTPGRKPINDAEVAIYAAPSLNKPAQGPYPARIDSLATEPAFTAKTTADDPDSAQSVYVTEISFDRPGVWAMMALIRKGDGYEASLLPTVGKVGQFPQIPQVGQKAPVIHTPTVSEVGDIAKIDTRVPHDSMHDADFAHVAGKKPTVLLFATPALCQSRVCGPVVDVEEQVKSEIGDKAAFIHMEVYKDNNASLGYRPQLSAYHLSTEPWLFVINKKGVITSRIEGAFSAAELKRDVEQAIHQS